MTSTMGIMTLSRGPCDLDNMSLFQDLKLKRRKVDSRCSSDGESAADTSTSSPDPGPPSPRMAEAGCSTPPHPPPVFDGGGSPSPSPSCHPTVIRSAPPYSVIKFEGTSSVKSENSTVNKHESTPSPQLSSVKLEATPPEPQPYRPRAIAQPQQSSHPALSPGHWPQAACINGVKPELIGGHFPPQPLEQKAGMRGSNQWRGAPAVIMGESGGVRTMFWTLPAPTAGNEPAASASHTATPPTPDPTTCSEESAARLLLNLGGELRRPKGPPLNMELLWAGDVSQLPAHQQIHALNLSAAAGSVSGITGVPSASSLVPRPELRTYAPETERDEDEQPMICMICEDKATGLHYGIITCEGCKGFFKRTVQNRRVYTCVADGGCEITKAQRNRCQYCRFKKCIEQGMVLQAVREDRMPGGRNSGAVYNLYKVKYKKHKKANTKAATTTSRASPPEKPKEPVPPLPPHLVNGTILKTALTNPSEVVHLRARLESAVSSSRDRAVPLERALHMIRALIDCDAMEDIATVRHLPDLLHDTSEIGDKLCKIGDSIVHKMVAWTKKLPFIMEIPMEIHSKLLMEKWHEISVLTTAAYQAMHGKLAHAPPSSDHEHDFMQEVNANLRTLQSCLTSLMGRPITLEQLRLDVGLVVEKMTQITCVFRRIQLRMEEYVCLKVYILLNQEVELESIQDRYVQVLRSYLEHAAPHHPGRLQELFARIPEIQAAANLLLESKMFYVPFVLNSAEIR
nr:hormone receptor 4 isoform X1 [Danaus plexippus plexippus]